LHISAFHGEKVLKTKESPIAIISNNPIRILHVDDDEYFLKIAKRCLELNPDIQVETATSVDEALDMIKTKVFDVIVSDYAMFEKDGLEFLRELRESGNMIPFILFTGKGREEVVEKALNLGAFRYMNKQGPSKAVYAELAASVRQAAEHARTQEPLVQDLTDQKKQEIQLQESEQKFIALFSGNPGAIVFLDKDFRVTDINPSFTALFGYKIEDIKGKSIIDAIVPDGFEEESEVIREKILLGPVGCGTVRKRNDGSYFNAAMSGGPVIINGNIIGFFMVYMDISDVVTVQEELSKALAKAELLNKKIGVLGGFTRHDVRNKLAVISGLLYLAREEAIVSPELEIRLQEVENVIKNITGILDFAKTYEMVGSEELVPIDVGEMIQNAISLFSELKGLKIENQCKDFVTVADSMVSEIFHNLIDNTLKYGQKTTKIRIFTENSDDGVHNLIYEDDGVGLDERARKHLFQKGFGRGTGYGLYLISQICEVYGWTVQEKGAQGQGVRFEFTIPAKKLLPYQ
jgi:PAS domain S-box-containing protein